MRLSNFNNGLSKELELSILKDTKEAILHLVNICREDFQSEEAHLERDEFKNILEVNSRLDDVDIKLVTRLDDCCYRAWVFEYKERGYVLFDLGNGYFEYVCTAEEMLLRLNFKNSNSEF